VAAPHDVQAGFDCPTICATAESEKPAFCAVTEAVAVPPLPNPETVTVLVDLLIEPAVVASTYVAVAS
jgi:hypothetical protein